MHEVDEWVLLLNIHGNHNFSVILVNFTDFMGDLPE